MKPIVDVARGRSASFGRSRRGASLLLMTALAFAGGSAEGNPGGGPSGCVHLCPAVWSNYVQNGVLAPCVVGIGVSSTPPYDRDVSVLPGSTIECGALEVHVTHYDLTVTDGGFLLKASRVLVSGSGNRIAALCNQSADKQGFRLLTTGAIDVLSGGELSTTCTNGAGLIDLKAAGDVTLNGATVTANAQFGRGGTIVVRADGDVTLGSGLEARSSASAGGYDGGGIVVEGDDVWVQGGLVATGVGASGGRIHVDGHGSLTIQIGGTIDASGTSGGDGGDVKLESAGTLSVSRAVKAMGAGSATYGGAISLSGETVTVNNDIVASGGVGGGSIEVESRGGNLRVANGVTATITFDVRRSGNNPGDGGQIDLRSLGGDVTLHPNALIEASGSGSGDGGLIEISGAGLTTVAASAVKADASSGGHGGKVTLRASGPLTVAGSVSASNLGTIRIEHRESSPDLSGISCQAPGCEVTQNVYLPPPCGDDIRRAGPDEDCDGADLAGASCSTVAGGFTGGTLACNSSCRFDTSGCTP
jgi:hypothetical protein